jgi:hypothetical protein
MNFAALNSAMNDGHPGINGDTAHLYFGSDRPGGGATANTWRRKTSCDAVTPTSISFQQKGGSQTVTISDGSNCGWAALPTQGWLGPVSAASGSGNGSVTIATLPNTGATRSASVRIGGRTVSITQKGRKTRGPSNLTSSISGSTVLLSWQRPEDDPLDEPSEEPLAYVLEAGTRSGVSDIVAGHVVGKATALTVNGVPPGAYFVRVRAVYSDYQSDPSNEIVVVVGGCSTLPAAPTGLSYAVSGGVVTLSWNAPSGAPVSSYLISAGVVPGHYPFEFDTGSNTPGFSAMAPPGTYYVRVQGRSNCGLGAGSELLVVVP